MVAYKSRDRRCPRCGTQVAQQARTCLLCGYRLDRSGFATPLLALISVAAITGIAIGILRDRSTSLSGTATAAGASAAVQTPRVTRQVTSLAVVFTSAPTATPTAAATVAPTAEAPADTATPEPTPTETPLPPPTETATAVATAGPIVHTVVKNDTLLSIANQYGSTVDAITAANGISEYSILSLGQQLIVPIPEGSTPTAVDAATPSPTLAPQFIVHVVEAGDTLFYLAGKYDVSVADIVSANEGLTERSTLGIGQQIRVPVPSATEVAPTAEATAQADASLTTTPTGQATAVAEASVTATTSLMSMGGPAQPSTLALISPATGAKVEASALILNWTGVGELAPDLWYVVNIWPVNQYDARVVGWTRANSWQPSADVIAAWGANPHLIWNVGIERETSDSSATDPTFEPAGPRTEPSDFYLVTG